MFIDGPQFPYPAPLPLLATLLPNKNKITYWLHLARAPARQFFVERAEAC